MYTPYRYRVTDEAAIDAFVEAHGFAALVSAEGGVPVATHVPIELVRDADGGRVLEGHVARANPHWKSWRPGTRALALFTGPHAYVSSTWYGHENVPTWNYQAVHLGGAIEVVTDREVLLQMLRRLARHYEPESQAGPRFDVERMTPSLRDAEILGIVGFRIRVDSVEASFKLSQNRDAADRARVIARLRERGDAGSLGVAAAMEEPASD